MKEKLVIQQGWVHDAIHREPYVADILVENGKIAEIAPTLKSRGIKRAKTIDAAGLQVYPGFVEAHCHLGLDGYGVGFEGSDYNEATDPITPQLSAIDGINPQDESFRLAMEGGVTCVAAGPGSSNVLGGTFAAFKTAGKCIDEMVVKEKAAMKCAFGENPKTCYKDKNNYSRMGTASKLRVMLERTQDYLARKDAAGDDILKCPPYDPKLEALIPVLEGILPLKAHVHQANDIFTAIRIAKEFHLRLALDHCTDGSLIAEELAKAGYPLAVGPTLGHATKFELKNKSFQTPGDLARAGCQVSIITDSPVIPQEYLALCAGLAVKSGMDEFDALQAITINAARHIGVEERVGSLEVGKDGDFVIAAGNPMVSDTKLQYVIIDGKVTYTREMP